MNRYSWIVTLFGLLLLVGLGEAAQANTAASKNQQTSKGAMAVAPPRQAACILYQRIVPTGWWLLHCPCNWRIMRVQRGWIRQGRGGEMRSAGSLLYPHSFPLFHPQAAPGRDLASPADLHRRRLLSLRYTAGADRDFGCRAGSVCGLAYPESSRRG